MKRLTIAVSLVLIGIGSAWAQPPPPRYATVPPPRDEIVPPSRGGRYIWEPGHWHWNGRAYVWIGGRYVPRHPHYAQYVPGRWDWAPGMGRWVWRPAHWE